MPNATPEPAKDYDNFINATWKRRTRIPPDDGSYSISDEVEDRLFKDLNRIFMKIHGNGSTAGADNRMTQLLSDFYHSGVTSRLQYNNVAALRTLIGRVDCIRDTDDVMKVLVQNQRMGIMAPFQLTISPDEHDSRISRLHIASGTLPISNPNFYERRESSTIVRQYHTYLSRLGKLLDIADLSEVIHTERDLARAFSADDATIDDPAAAYRQISTADLPALFPAVPWTILWRTLDSDRAPPHSIITLAPRFLGHLNHLFAILTIPRWRILIKYEIAASLIPYLPPPFDELHFGFFGRAINGHHTKPGQRRLVIDAMRQGIPDAVGWAFINATSDSTAIARKTRATVTEMFGRLVHAMLAHISRNPWMSKSTQEAALKKVAAIYARIGFPDHWNQYRGLALTPTCFVDNILACNSWQWDHQLHYLDAPPPPRHIWNSCIVDVNAYYYPDENLIVIPLGILQPPFFEVTAPPAWNYGGIGAAVGHELAHSVDNEGRQYDKHGNLVDWWTPGDSRRFNTRAGQLQRALSHTRFACGHVNGEQTLAEAIADLIGLRIALNALQVKVGGAATPEMLRDFFKSFATSWESVAESKTECEELAVDVHPPPHVRINLTVAQMPEWYEAYNIPPKEVIETPI